MWGRQWNFHPYTLLLFSNWGHTTVSHGLRLHKRSRDSDQKRGPGPCPLARAVGSRVRILVGDATGLPKHQGPFGVPAIFIIIIIKDRILPRLLNSFLCELCEYLCRIICESLFFENPSRLPMPSCWRPYGRLWLHTNYVWPLHHLNNNFNTF